MAGFGSSEAGKKGGKARADKLTKKERSEIARKAAEARWGDIPSAEYEGSINFGDIKIPCAVLADETRVLSERGVTKGFGLKRAGSNWQRKTEGGARLPVFLSANNLKPFISADLRSALNPIRYKPITGGIANGVNAELIPKICDVWLKARDAGDVIKAQQRHIVVQADIIMRGLAQVGIVALVDEATGYQRDRARDELARILEAFVAKEIQGYLRTFDLEFYELMCDLRGEPLDRVKSRPPYFGKLTDNLVYQRLAPGVRGKLRELNPVQENGRRKRKHFQHLTPDLGHPKLREHIAGVTTAMKLAKLQGWDWQEFIKMLDKTHPKQKELPLLDHLDD